MNVAEKTVDEELRAELRTAAALQAQLGVRSVEEVRHHHRHWPSSADWSVAY
jgi:hypothetical protein